MSKLISDEEKFKKLSEYTTDFIGVVEALDDKAKVIVLIESTSGISLMSGSSSMSSAEVLGQMRLFTLRSEQQQIINYNKRVFVQDQMAQQMRDNLAQGSFDKDYKAN